MDPITKTLETKARDNHGYEYPVQLFLSMEPAGAFGSASGAQHLAAEFSNRWVLRIKGTPGSWYMSTLLERGVQSQIALDFGQGWMCTNFAEIMREAMDNI
jgi:hypothetical protein